MLFFLLLNCFPLLISQSLTCLGFNTTTNSCLECPPNYYRKLSVLNPNKELLNISIDCAPKLPQKYTKKFYIRNISCSSTVNNSLCLGTRENPFDNLIKTLLFIHINDTAEKFTEQEIEIFLLGSPHFIKNGDLLYDGMRLFSRFNATIRIGPLFCEGEEIGDCFEKGGIVDLNIKTDGFSFEIYRELVLFNLRIFANDIVLYKNSSLSCFQNSSICCTTSSFKTGTSCKIDGKVVYLNTSKNLGKAYGFITLRYFLDYNYGVSPRVNLTNFILAYANSVKGEEGWLSFILFFDLYSLCLNNVTLNYNSFPLGFFDKMSIEDDPYYKRFLMNGVSTYLISQSLYNNIIVTNMNLSFYNNYKVKYAIDEYYGLFNLKNETLFNTQIEIIDSVISQITMDFDPKTCFLFQFSSQINSIKPSFIIRNLTFYGNVELGLFNLHSFSFQSLDFKFYNLNNSKITTLIFTFSEKIIINDILLRNSTFSNSIFPFLSCSNTSLALLKGTFSSLSDIYLGSFNSSNIEVYDFVLISVKNNLTTSQIFLFDNSNFTFKNFSLEKNSISCFLSIFKSEQRTFNNISIQNMVYQDCNFSTMINIKGVAGNLVMDISNSTAKIINSLTNQNMYFIRCEESNFLYMTVTQVYFNASRNVSISRFKKVIFNKIMLDQVKIENHIIIYSKSVAIDGMKSFFYLMNTEDFVRNEISYIVILSNFIMNDLQSKVLSLIWFRNISLENILISNLSIKTVECDNFLRFDLFFEDIHLKITNLTMNGMNKVSKNDINLISCSECFFKEIIFYEIFIRDSTKFQLADFKISCYDLMILRNINIVNMTSYHSNRLITFESGENIMGYGQHLTLENFLILKYNSDKSMIYFDNLGQCNVNNIQLINIEVYFAFLNFRTLFNETQLNFTNVFCYQINIVSIDIFYVIVWNFGVIQYAVLKNITVLNVRNVRLFFFDGLIFKNLIITDFYANNITTLDYFLFGVRNANYYPSFLLIRNLTVLNFYYNYVSLVSIRNFDTFEMVDCVFKNSTTQNNRKDYDGIFMIRSIKNIVFDHLNFTNNCLGPASPLFLLVNIAHMNFRNSILIDSDLVEYQNNSILKFQVINMDDYLEFLMENNTIIGMSTVLNSQDIVEEYGIISLKGSSFYFAESERKVARFYGNSFFRNVGRKQGIIGITEGNTVYFLNNTFSESKVNFGVIMLNRLDNVIIRNIDVSFSSSLHGGTAIYIQTIFIYVFIENAYLTDLSSEEEGGAISLFNIPKMIVSNMKTVNCNARFDGGVLNVMNIWQSYFSNTIFLSSSSGYNGGVIYAYESAIFFNNSYFNSGKANISGGLAYILGSKSQFVLENSLVLNFSSNSDGGTICTSNIMNLAVFYSSILGSSIKADGYGIISQEGFSNSNTEFGVLNLYRVILFNNTAKFGANIFFSSNNILIFKYVNSLSNFGSLCIVESEIFQKMVIERCNFIKNNYESDYKEKIYLEEYLNAPLFRLVNTFIVFNGTIHISNKGMIGYFKVISSIVQFEQLYLENYSCNFQADDPGEKFLLDIEKSNFLIENSDFNYDQTIFAFSISFIHIKDSNLIISSSYLSNFQTERTKEVFLSKSSTIFINSSFFLNLQASQTVFNIKFGNLTIQNSLFQDYENLITIPLLKNKYLSFESLEPYSTFLNISETSFQLSCDIFISAAFLTGLIVENSLFNPFFHENQGFYQALLLTNIKRIEIRGCIFKNFIYNQGSCIFLIENDKMKTEEAFFFLINSTKFINNTGLSGAVIYLAGSIKLTIIYTIFALNSAKMQLISQQQPLNYNENAGKAGCILFDNENFDRSSLNIISSLFIKNYAEYFGPTVLTKSKIDPQIENSNFTSNRDHINMTETILSFPLRFYLLSYKFKGDEGSEDSNFKKTKLFISKYGEEVIGITSGQDFNFTILITDFFNHSLISDSECVGELFCSISDGSSSIYLIERAHSQSSHGTLFFNEVKITFYPDSLLFCQVQVKYNENMVFISKFGRSSSYYRLNIKIYVQNCTRGEIFLYDFTCFPCQRGSYSLQNPMLAKSNKNCLPCPPNAFCHGRDLITPLKGYWRASSNSTLILKCPSQESCFGIGEHTYLINSINFDELSEEVKVHGVCSPNNYGSLCLQCKKGLARVKSNSECSECGTLYIIYIKLGLSMLFIISYVVFQTKIFSEIEKNDPHLAILTKIFLNHFQTISLINLIDLGWTIDFDIYFSIQNYLSFISEDFFIIDCFIQQIDENMLYQKTIFAVLLPVLLSIIMGFIWLALFCYLSAARKINLDEKISDYMINKMRMTFLIFVFFLYPEILRKSFTLLNCMSIDDSSNVQVLAKSPNIECWTIEHQFWVLTISVPGIAFWGVFAPLFFLFILIKYKLQIEMSLKRSRMNLESNVRCILPKSKRKRTILKKKIVYLEQRLADEIFDGKLAEAYEIGYYIRNIKCIHSLIFCIEESEKINLIKNKKKTQKQENLTQLRKYLPDEASNNLSKLLAQSDLEKYSYFIYDEEQEIADEQNKLEDFSKPNTKLTKEKETKRQFSSPKKTKSPLMSLRTKILIRNLGFIYRGYRKEVYFWEIIIFARKFFLIFIGIYADSFPQNIKPTILVMFLVGYLYLQIQFKPYEFKYLNYLETFSLVSAFFTTCIGIIMFSDKMKFLAVFFVVCIFLFNFCFLWYWGKYIFTHAKIKQKFGYLLKSLTGTNKMKAKYKNQKKILAD